MLAADLQVTRIIEAFIFTATTPVSVQEIKKLLQPE